MNIEIYFDVKQHKYTDNLLNSYTSVTTVIGNYENKFDEKQWDIARACERIGKNPRHPKYPKYKNKSAKQIIAGWKREGDKGRNIGNETHDYLEDSVKFSSNFVTPDVFKNNRLFTIKDLLDNPNLNLGILNLDSFVKTGVKDKYPLVYKTLQSFINNGWKIYSEIAVFNYDWLVAGLIDILLIKDDKFIILDWKTNKAPIKFEAGYYEKDNDGKLGAYLLNDEVLKPPLSKLASSTGIKYSLQVSTYSYLVEQLGLTNVALILCHIRHDFYKEGDSILATNPELLGKQVVDIMKLNYYKDDVVSMLKHFTNSKLVKNKQQTNLFEKAII